MNIFFASISAISSLSWIPAISHCYSQASTVYACTTLFRCMLENFKKITLWQFSLLLKFSLFLQWQKHCRSLYFICIFYWRYGCYSIFMILIANYHSVRSTGEVLCWGLVFSPLKTYLNLVYLFFKLAIGPKITYHNKSMYIGKKYRPGICNQWACVILCLQTAFLRV